jgi:hypothetical protein
MPNNNLINERDVPSSWEPAESPMPSSGATAPTPHDMPQLLAGSIAPSLQHDTSFVSTAVGSPRVPSFSLMPPAASASASANAAAKSVALNQSNNSTKSGTGPSSGTGGGNVPSSGGGGGGSSQITLNIPNIFTPITQTVTLPGPLAFTLAVEPAGTVFSGPTNAAVGFDGAFFSTTSSSGAGSLTVVGGVPSNPSGEYAVYIAVGGNGAGALTFTGAPAGWTALGGSTGVSPEYAIAVPSTGVSAIDTWAAGPSEASGMIVYLNGALPSFANFASATPGNTSVSKAITGMTVGNSILVLCHCVLRFGLTGGVISDSQGNTPILLGTVGQPFGVGGAVFGSQVFAYLIPAVSAASDTVTFSISPASTSNSIRMVLYEISPSSAIAAIPRFQLPPPANVSNATGILPPANGGTGANLSATGGASEVVMQTTVGGAFTVAQLAASDLSNGTTGSGAIVLATAPTLSSLLITGKITNYNNLATVSNGVASIVATIDLTAQAAAITPATLYAVNAGRPGMYRISWVATVTTVDTVSSTLGPFQILYTDFDTSVVKTMPGTPVAGVDSNITNSTSTGTNSGCFIGYVLGGTTIQYEMGYASSVPGTMKYNLHIKVELMG